MSTLKDFFKKLGLQLLLLASLQTFITPAYALIPKTSKVSSNDTTAGYLNGKLVAGTGITFTENNDGGDETLTITNGLGTANGAGEFLYIEGATADNYETILGSVDPTADRTILFPNASVAASDVVVGSAANTLAYVNLGNTQILIGDGSGVPTAAALSGDATMTNAGVVTVADDSHSHTSSTLPATTSYLGSSIDSSEITDDSIVNADINSAAAISYSKLASLTSGNILVGSAGNVATSVSMSGDATLSNTGALTIADNSVDGTDIAFGSDAQGDVYYNNGTDVVRLAAGTSGQYFKTQGAGANPKWDTPAGAGDMLQAVYDANANSVVDTATALAANGANCSAGNYPLGVDASGAVESCTAISAAGDASTNTSSSVDSEIALFSSTGGKTLKRATSTGILTGTSGVIGTITDSHTNWDTAYTNRITSATAPLSITSNAISVTADGVGATQIDETANYAFTGTLINDGSNPTVATAGKIGFDTTQSQLLVGASTNVFSPTHSASVSISDVTSADDNILFFVPDRDITVTAVACRYEGTGSTVATFTLENAKAGTGMTITGTNPTCVTGNNAAAFAAVTANNAITKGDGIRFDTTNTTNPLTDDYTIIIQYTEDRK